MKTTKEQFEQIIREALVESWRDEVGPPPDTSTPSGQADYEDWERRARAAERRAARRAAFGQGEEKEDDEMDLELSYEEFDLATAALLYADDLANEKKLHDPPWAKAVFTVIDSQYGESADHVGTGNHIVEISKPSLRTLNWALNIRELPAWLENNKYINDETTAELPAFKERVQALLTAEEKQPEPEEKQPEPKAPERDDRDQRFAHLDIPSPESVGARALKRYEEGKSMKITKEQIRNIIREEFELSLKEAGRQLPDWPEYVLRAQKVLEGFIMEVGSREVALQAVDEAKRTIRGEQALEESRQAGFLGPGFSNALPMQEAPGQDPLDWSRAVGMPLVREIGEVLRKELGDEVVGRIRTNERTRQDPVHWLMLVELALTKGLPTMLEIKVYMQYATVKIGGDEVETIEYPGLESQGGLADVIAKHVQDRLWYDAEAGYETLADRKFADRPE